MPRTFPPTLFSFTFFVMALCLCFGQAPVFSDPDTAWHLAAGDLIRAHGLPLQDSWSFTAGENTWFNLSWLFDVCASFLMSHAGLAGLYTLTIAVFAACIAFMAQYCIARGAGPVAVGLLLFPTMFIVYIGVLARPNMVSVVFSLAFYCILHRYRSRGDFRELLVLPVIMALWANIHGGFLLAFRLIGVFLAEACLYPGEAEDSSVGMVIAVFLHRWRYDKKFRGLLALPLLICLLLGHDRGWQLFLPPLLLTLLLGCADATARQHKARVLAIVLALCMGATLLNPYHLAVYYGAYATLTTSFARYVMEWRAIDVAHNIPYAVWLVVALCVGSFTDKRIPFADRILAVAMIVMSLSSVRHSLVASLLLLPYLSLSLTSLIRESGFAGRIEKQEATFLADMGQKPLRIGAACLIPLALALLYMPWLRDHGLTKPIAFPTDRFPSVEAQYILDHYPAKCFLNHYDLGGYLVYLWRGKQKDFVDGRASSVFSEELLKDYGQFMDDTGFSLRSQFVANYYRIDGLIVPNDAKNDNFHANPAWKEVYRGPVATIYLKAAK